MGILKRAISKDASAVSMALDATDIVNEIEQIHKPSAVVTAALGRLTIAASMLGWGVHIFNPNIQEAEAGVSLRSRLVWST